MVENASVTLDAWHHWRSVFEAPAEQSTLELGYATFFLNRCNRSGILSARPIGGLDQSGRWKIDARFNASELATRIRLLGDYRGRVRITEMDARSFLRLIEGEDSDSFAYVDPPYLVQGDDLYLDALTSADHRELAELLRASRLRWMLTYDVHDSIPNDLYSGLRAARFSIAHTAQRQHVGSEYVVFSDNLAVPHLELVSRANAEWVAV
jgi:DNA adenine methylase